MIYVLVRDAQGYDDCDRMIFASTSKERVEQEHDKLRKNHEVMQRFAKMVQHDMELFSKENPPPRQPDLASLPLRPLVWGGGGWNNAYMVEYEKEMRGYNEKVNAFREELIQTLKKSVPFSEEQLKEVDDIWYHLYDYTYSIEEVESD